MLWTGRLRSAHDALSLMQDPAPPPTNAARPALGEPGLEPARRAWLVAMRASGGSAANGRRGGRATRAAAAATTTRGARDARLRPARRAPADVRRPGSQNTVRCRRRGGTNIGRRAGGGSADRRVGDIGARRGRRRGGRTRPCGWPRGRRGARGVVVAGGAAGISCAPVKHLGWAGLTRPRPQAHRRRTHARSDRYCTLDGTAVASGAGGQLVPPRAPVTTIRV